MAQFGISPALPTPFDADGAMDTARLAAHAAEMIRRGAASVTLYGTTGEGASIAEEERQAGIDALRDAGVSADRIVLGLCANAAADAVAQVHKGLSNGVTRFLLPPPFYFPGVDDAGLFAWFARVLGNTDADAGFVLYHIPQVTGIGLSTDLVARLNLAFPGRVVALKDSSGDWAAATSFLQDAGVPVLLGDERMIHRAVPLGCAGAISGMANIHLERMMQILATGQEDIALSASVDRVVSVPVIPAVKVLLAQAKSDPVWENVRPPLTPLSAEQRADLLAAESAEPAHG